MICEVYLPDAQVNYYAENVISDNIISQVDDEGYSVALIDSIVDYNIYG